MSKFQDIMRRVITGDNARGQSVIIIDGGPSSEKGNPDLGEMFEIWEDESSGPLTPSANEDLGATRPVLGPRKGNFQVRWFVIHPRVTSKISLLGLAFFSSGACRVGASVSLSRCPRRVHGAGGIGACARTSRSPTINCPWGPYRPILARASARGAFALSQSHRVGSMPIATLTSLSVADTNRASLPSGITNRSRRTPFPAVAAHSNRSLLGAVSVAGKRNFEARDKGAEMAVGIHLAARRDHAPARKSANSALKNSGIWGTPV